MSSDSYRGNKNLRKAGVQQEWTKEQVIEYTKCSADPIYFIKKYVQIVHVDEGIVPFELWPFQERLIEDIHNNRFVAGLWGRQQGKCLQFSESINIRNKKTGEIQKIAIGDFYEAQKRKKENKED